jgi:hypothetical protein
MFCHFSAVGHSDSLTFAMNPSLAGCQAPSQAMFAQRPVMFTEMSVILCAWEMKEKNPFSALSILFIQIVLIRNCLP